MVHGALNRDVLLAVLAQPFTALLVIKPIDARDSRPGAAGGASPSAASVYGRPSSFCCSSLSARATFSNVAGSASANAAA